MPFGTELISMSFCKECKKFFPGKEDSRNGDCVERTVDPRQAYYKAKPVSADMYAISCSSFEKK
jgi:benzylsuccinate synthase